MARDSELIKNTFLISLAQISAQAVNFLLLPVYTSVLSTEEYGQIDLYATLRSVLTVILFMGIEQSLFRFCVSEKNMQKKKEYFSAGVALAIILFILFSFIFIISSQVYKFQYAILLYAYYFIYGIYYLLIHIARGFEKTGIYALATMSGTVLTTILNIILVVCMRFGVKGVLVSSILAYTLIILCMAVHLPLRATIIYKWEKSRAKEMLSYSLPLVLNNVMSWVAISSDRLIIVAILGNSMNGIYSLANKFYTILVVMTTGFTMAWAETAVKVVQQPGHKEYYRKIICRSMDVYFLIISGMITVLPFFFEHVINPAYASAYYHIPIIIYAAFWYTASSVIGYILLAHKKSGEMGIGTLLVAITNLVVHVALIGKIGLFAASVSTLVSYVGLFAFRFYFMYRCEKITFPFVKAFIQLCIYLALCVCYYRKGYVSLIIETCIYLLCITSSVKIYWEELCGLWKGIQRKVKRERWE